MFCRFWNDEDGSILTIEVVLAATVLGIGILTGLTSLRDATITELADVGGAVAFLDQSFTVRGVKAHSSATADNTFVDSRDYCDDGAVGNVNSRCLSICGDTFAVKPDGSESP